MCAIIILNDKTGREYVYGIVPPEEVEEQLNVVEAIGFRWRLQAIHVGDEFAGR